MDGETNMTELTIEEQIKAAYAESQKWFLEDQRLKDLELEIAMKRREAHQNRLIHDEKLWVLQHRK
jgi:hypothetical protein